MAALFFDSFDHYALALMTQKWNQIDTSTAAGDNSTINSAAGRRGTNGLQIGNGAAGAAARGSNNFRVTPDMPSPSGTTVIVGFAFQQVEDFIRLSASSCRIVDILSSSTTRVRVSPNNDGTLSVYNAAGTVVGTTARALHHGITYYLEFKFVLHGSTGTADVRVDGVNVLSLTGLNLGGTTWSTLKLGPTATPILPGSNAVTWYVDDLYICDGSGTDSNDFLGDVRIDCLRPTADGFWQDFSQSSGTDNFAMVDETLANSDTDYNYSGTVGAIDTFITDDLPISGALVKGVQLVSQARKEDAGTALHKGVVRISSTDYVGATRGVPSSYEFLRNIFTLSPATGVAWTDTEINATEFGYKKHA